MWTEYFMRLLRGSEKGKKKEIEKNINKILRYYEKNPEKQRTIEELLVKRINSKETTFLHWLAILGNAKLFRKLINLGVNYKIQDRNGKLPLDYAEAFKHQRIIELLTKKNQQILDVRSSYTTLVAPPSKINTFESQYVKYKINYLDVIYTGHNYDWLAKPTGQIVKFEAGQVSARFCTGFNIGNNLFLTAGHCLGDICRKFDDGNEKIRVSFNYQYTALSVNSENVAIQENIYKINKIIEHGICAENIDYAILELEPSAMQYFGALNLDASIPEINDKLALAHHPAGLPKKISTGIVTRYDEKTGIMFHSAPTLKGSSGSPVADEKTQSAISVHVTGDEHDQSKEHGSVTINCIAKVSTVIDQLGKFGLFKTSIKEKSLAVSPQRRIGEVAKLEKSLFEFKLN